MLRNGLMQSVVDGLPQCVRDEHVALFQLIRDNQPNAPFTVNHNGVFVSLANLNTDVLRKCHQLVRHGLAQDQKEQRRARVVQRLQSRLRGGMP